MSKLTQVECGRIGGQITKEFWLKKYKENPKFCSFCNKKITYEKKRINFVIIHVLPKQSKSLNILFNNIKNTFFVLYLGHVYNLREVTERLMVGR